MLVASGPNRSCCLVVAGFGRDFRWMDVFEKTQFLRCTHSQLTEQVLADGLLIPYLLAGTIQSSPRANARLKKLGGRGGWQRAWKGKVSAIGLFYW